MDNQAKIAAIKAYQDRTGECPSVLRAVVFYLEHDDLAGAQHKIMLDSDKFSNFKETLRFFDSLGLLSTEYRDRLIRWGNI